MSGHVCLALLLVFLLRCADAQTQHMIDDDPSAAAKVTSRGRAMRRTLRESLHTRMRTNKHVSGDAIRAALDTALALDEDVRGRLRTAAPNASRSDLETWFDGEGDLHVLGGPDGHMLEVTINGSSFPALAPSSTVHQLRSAESVPIHGFLLDGVFVLDPLHVAAKCRHRLGDTHGDCAVGSRRLRNVTRDEARRSAHETIYASVVTSMNKWRPASSSSASGATSAPPSALNSGRGGGSDASLPSAARLLYVDGAQWAQGGRNIVVLRVQYASMADSTTIISASRTATVCAQMASFYSNMSYGRLQPTVICPMACVYPVTIAEANAEIAGTTNIATEALAAARAATGACTVTIPANANVLFLLPRTSFSWCGLGQMPGAYSWVHGDSCAARWLWGHEQAHNVRST